MPSLTKQAEAVSEGEASRAKHGIELLSGSEDDVDADDVDAQKDAKIDAATREQGEAWDKWKEKGKAAQKLIGVGK